MNPRKPSPDRLGIRVNLTVDPEIVAILDRLGAVTGAGRATIIREWLAGAAPIMAEMARAAELASQRNVDAFKVMSDAIGSAVENGQQLQLEMKAGRRKAMRKRKRD